MPISGKVYVVIQSVLVQHFRPFNKSYDWNISQLMILILLQKKYLRLAVCRKRQAIKVSTARTKTMHSLTWER